MDLVFGFDGGGTSCRAALADLSGRVLGRGVSGAANTSSDPQAAVRHIVAAAEAALEEAGLDAAMVSRLPAFLGLAGWNVGSGGVELEDMLPFSQSVIEDDAGIALQGALGDGDGVVAVLGTGSVYLGRRADKVSRLGGWGFVVGDLGSGAWLGRALLQATLLAHDGITAHSPLTRRVFSDFRSDPAAIVRFAQAEKPSGFAKFAPLVFEFADASDVVAARLVGEGVGHVEAALSTIVWPDCPRLAMLGGVSRFYAARIDPRFADLLVAPAGDALDGAVQLAVRRFRPEVRTVA